MKRTIHMPTKPTIRPTEAKPRRERTRLGLRYEAVTGEGVSGLR